MKIEICRCILKRVLDGFGGGDIVWVIDGRIVNECCYFIFWIEFGFWLENFWFND